ncbi:unnamed protein product [Ascophyllum nodosum]
MLRVLLLAQLVQGITTLPARFGGAHSEGSTDPNLVVRHEIVFQMRDCPQMISEAEAFARKKDTDPLRGNTITMTSQCTGRTGNHFVNLSQFLAMGYCCKSKVLELPRSDETFTGSAGGHFTSEKRFFDFSNTDVMPLEEYHELSERPEVCRPTIRMGYKRAYRLVGIHPDLLSCMNHVYLRGCEAAYLGAMVKTSEFCAAGETSFTSPPGVNAAQFVHDVNDHHVENDQESKSVGGSSSVGGHSQERGPGAGSLAIHIRSGDIFEGRLDSRRYGQPPLQFYTKIIANKQWDDISVLTYAKTDELINPTYTALEEMKATGILGPNVKFFKNRSFKADMEAMLCANGVAFARSSLALMISAHGRASYLYVPLECGPGTYARSTRNRTSPKIVQDNTTLLAIEKPDAQIYGIEWESGGEAYSVYTSFNKSSRQRSEMLEFDGIKRLQRCGV